MSELKKKSSSDLRKFGITMAIPLALIAGLMIWRGNAWWPHFGGLAAAFLLCALFLPRVLAPVERGWMALAGALSVLMTYVLMTLTFFLVITPMGLLLRILGKDPLNMKREKKGQKSFWIPVESDGPWTRPNRPY